MERLSRLTYPAAQRRLRPMRKPTSPIFALRSDGLLSFERSRRASPQGGPAPAGVGVRPAATVARVKRSGRSNNEVVAVTR